MIRRNGNNAHLVSRHQPKDNRTIEELVSDIAGNKQRVYRRSAFGGN